MRYVSLFSGIEAASVAWEPLGWEPMAFSEIEPFPCVVLEHNFPDVLNLGDITKIDWSDYVGAVDLVVGGSPCQSFSVAGKREGLAGESGLMFEYIRAVREIRPRCFIWENVPGALSSEGGAAFGQLLREMDGIGYGLAWRVLDAQFFGVAQRRRRVFLVGVLGDGAAPAEILFEPESLRWDHPSSKAKRQELARAARSGASGPDAFGILGNVVDRNAKCNGFGVSEGVAPTLNTVDRHAVACADEGAVLAFCGQASSGASSIGAAWELAPTLRSGSCGLQAPTICMADANANAAIDVEMAGTLKVGGEPPICFAHRATSAASGIWRWPWTVRRLTPLECERLQGFPDGFTRIPYRGKPADQCPDGPRYSALGNSMAVPVMRWIGERIESVLGR